MILQDDLKKVREIIASGWTQEATAVNARNSPVDPTSQHAVKWSLYGATIKVYSDTSAARLVRSLHRAMISLYSGYRTLKSFNAALGRTQKQVLIVIDLAIKNER